jgi:hypothetical protein
MSTSDNVDVICSAGFSDQLRHAAGYGQHPSIVGGRQPSTGKGGCKPSHVDHERTVGCYRSPQLNLAWARQRW